ncbi:hypothetical protein [Streptomyces guryensis]|uniref:Uncharacterized protein n=1 Tax=Streptomyces guryensis TaxID=2886947 RepID=A0A9Q3ZF58_9ACTN|nr:hypothetical protein [Streptomyces guryensis]MCD9880200.1 hypothetical protein [Streptomyces guryensis]
MIGTRCTAVLAARSAGSASPRLAALHPDIPMRALTPVPARQVVRQVMREALDHIVGPDRRRVPAFVAAAPYVTYTATYFAERHEDPARRLRPSHSIQMECSRLVQGLDDDLDQANRWAGDLFILCTPELDVRQSVQGAEAALAVGAQAALVCDITVTPPWDPDRKPAALSAAAMLLVRATAGAATGDLALWPPAAAAHQTTAAETPA